MTLGLPKIVSLFSGAGGLDLGFSMSGFRLQLAVDRSEAAIRTHRRNFPGVKSLAADLVELGAAGVLAALQSSLEAGEAIGVIGGPPCQGFSRANTRARADDPRNKLPMLYLEIIEALQAEYDVRFVLFENVLGIRDTKHSVVFRGILAKFRDMDLHAAEVREHNAIDYGVAQNRRRVIISAFSDPACAGAFAPVRVEANGLTVRGKIGGLPGPAFFSRGLDPESIPFHRNHWTMRPRSKRFADLDGVQPSGRSFRRLSWDKPSPTVAYGHREIHVHPDGRRRLSVYEAMLLQGFDHGFVLEGTLSEQVEQVSNAVPPPVAVAMAKAIEVALISTVRSPGSTSALTA